MKKTPYIIFLFLFAAVCFLGLWSKINRSKDDVAHRPAPEYPAHAEPGIHVKNTSGELVPPNDTATRHPKALPIASEHVAAAVAGPVRKVGEPHIAPPVPRSFPARKTPQMGWADAQYVIAGKEVRPGNNSGRLSPVKVKPSENVFVSMQWPDAIRGSSVAVEVVDGGRLDDNEISKLLEIGADGNIDFTFVANDMPGRCQVVVRHGMDETALTFWVESGRPENEPPTL